MKHFDVLIIGCGISGLASAIRLAESGLSIGVLTREEDPLISNTYWAQGGIIHPKKDDRELVEDIMRASSQTSFLPAIEKLIEEGPGVVDEVLLKKVSPDFESNEEGYLYTKEAAHSTARILYRGDFTGREIQVSMLNYLKDKDRFPNVEILSCHTAIDLLTPTHHGTEFQQKYEEHRVLGVYSFNQKEGRVETILAGFTILATGGIGGLYLHHSNSEGARGDGHAMARRAGAILTDMEFIQFHPTTFYDGTSHRRFLISEALRGEGGRLINSEGLAFMEKYHPDAELAPRDVVARAIAEEILETRHDSVFLDITHKDRDWIRERFPTIYEYCLKHRIDMTKDPIPVVPAAHYTCGGIKVDLEGKTSLNHLYAVGEVACTGLHGANRLASTSLLEGLVFGHLAAESILNKKDMIRIENSHRIRPWQDGTKEVEKALIQQDWNTLKQTMWNYVGLTRSSSRLGRADAMFKELYDEIQKFYKHTKLTDSLIGLRNAVEVGSIVLKASKRRQESIGCFTKKN